MGMCDTFIIALIARLGQALASESMQRTKRKKTVGDDVTLTNTNQSIAAVPHCAHLLVALYFKAFPAKTADTEVWR